MTTTSRQVSDAGFADLARRVGASAIAGFAMGAIVGGLGGRLAMLVLRLTSDPSLRGLDTDDGFTIGIVSAATMFLVVLTAVLGVLGGLAYLLARAWLPPRRRTVVFASLAAVVGGSLVIRPGGIDFTLLDPLWLAIALFVALPATFGAAVATLIERWLPATSNAWLAGLALAALPLPFFGLRGLALLAVVLLAALATRVVPEIRGVFASRALVWIGRTGLAAIGAAAMVALVSDVAEIL